MKTPLALLFSLLASCAHVQPERVVRMLPEYSFVNDSKARYCLPQSDNPTIEFMRNRVNALLDTKYDPVFFRLMGLPLEDHVRLSLPVHDMINGQPYVCISAEVLPYFVFQSKILLN